MVTSTATPQQIHNIFFSIPRTASNLVTQLLNLAEQPSISRHSRDGYFFLPALGARYKHDTFAHPIEDWTDEAQEGMRDALQTSLNAWQKSTEEAEQNGRGTFIKEHINWMIEPTAESRYLHSDNANHDTKALGGNGSCNLTCIPDAFFAKVYPTFLIRHPALTFPSLLRTALDNEGIDESLKPTSEVIMRWECTYHWHITLYKYLVTTGMYPRDSSVDGINFPIILDAADLANPGLVHKYAAAVSLSPSLVRFVWDSVGEEEQGAIGGVERRMKDTLLVSKGVVKEKLNAHIDLGVERKKWRKEFGEVLCERLVLLVEGAMGDYEWLWERRFKV